MQGAARFAIYRKPAGAPERSEQQLFPLRAFASFAVKVDFLTHPNQARPCKQPMNRSVYQYPA
jgi:hypothetical protein